jgi:L-lactate dehydrogenase complex protein LldG
VSSARDAFLQQVRQAVRSGNRPGAVASLEPRGSVGYQGAGADAAARFGEALVAAGGVYHRVPDHASAVIRTLELVQTASAQRLLLGRNALLDSLRLLDPLRAAGREVLLVDSLPPGDSRPVLFAADLGISGVDYLIAETGSVVLTAQPSEPRSLSLLPPVHVAVAERSQLLPDLFDLFEPGPWASRDELPSFLGLITGPSKTGDIELRLVTGVHGPREIHVILIGN